MRIEINISLIFSIIMLLFVGCNQSQKQTVFCYQLDESQYRIILDEQNDSIRYYKIQDFLDENFEGTSQTTVEHYKVELTDSIISCRNLEFLKERIVGKCHTFNFNLDADFPLWDYTSCLIRNVQDTVINEVAIASCGVYQLIKDDEMKSIVIFDWINYVLVQHINLETKASLQLVVCDL